METKLWESRTIPSPVTLPGRVWEDYLDPLASGMQADIGLPAPTWRKVGKGTQAIYSDVTCAQALELVEYLRDRAEMLLTNEEPEYRGVHRSAIEASKKILALVTLEKRRVEAGR